MVNKIKQYPIVLIFFIFLIGFSVFDAWYPKRPFSELENRTLQQYPTISLSGVLDNSWMVKYEAYVKDQFALRDNWIELKSLSETASLKTENNDILFGKDNYLFKKTLAVNSRFDTNLGALERFTQRHAGQVDVMIVPSASTVLTSLLPAYASIANENEYLDKIFSTVGSTANVYDMREVLSQHSGEYIYYRTDHHWTALGAFYAYEQYASANGKPVFDRGASEAVEVPDFYGTSYSSARRIGAIADTITYYNLSNVMTVFNTQTDGSVTQETGTLYDTEKFATRDKYAAFLRGNNGYSEVQGNGEGSILVVKDSYANSFIPYLTADYAKIGVVDFRANLTKIDKIMQDGGYDKVLFLYSFDGFSSDTYFGSKIASE